jgi:hypothetical protein
VLFCFCALCIVEERRGGRQNRSGGVGRGAGCTERESVLNNLVQTGYHTTKPNQTKPSRAESAPLLLGGLGRAANPQLQDDDSRQPWAMRGATDIDVLISLVRGRYAREREPRTKPGKTARQVMSLEVVVSLSALSKLGAGRARARDLPPCRFSRLEAGGAFEEPGRWALCCRERGRRKIPWRMYGARSRQ